MIAQSTAGPEAEQDILTLDTMLPDLLRRRPQARRVLDRYGLSGCGGVHGPVESVGFFARTHGVDEERLMAEVREAAEAPDAGDIAAAPPAALEDSIYRRYFAGGIIVALTAGATWGAWLLWKIAIAHSFTGNSVLAVNAHGSAQIFGWMGLFIMGFAYQALPRLWHTRLAAPKLAAAAFALMLAGLVAGTIGQTTAGVWRGDLPLAMAGGAAMMLAIAIFVAQMLATFRRGEGRWEPYVAFVVLGLVWFVAMGAMSLWHTYTTMSATTREGLLWYVATYQAPLRDLQIHGVALFMILGVSIRMLPSLFGVQRTAGRRAWWGLALLTTAVAGEVALFIAYRWTGNHVLAACLMAPWIMLAAGTWLVAGPWKLWRKMPEGDRSAKFVRMAYAWLAASLLMLLALPAYQALSGIPFSHAYYGAIRHAITVGFVSLMIMGLAAKVVPTLNGVDTRKLRGLWGPFVLINLGCFLRVSLQVLTDWHPAAYKVVGVSGMLEVTALAWWGIGLIAIMLRGKREMAAARTAADRPQRVEAGHIVADVLEWFPETLDVFVGHGMGLLRNPVMRRTLARTVTVKAAAGHAGVMAEELLAGLNEAIGAPPAGVVRLRVLG